MLASIIHHNRTTQISRGELGMIGSIHCSNKPLHQLARMAQTVLINRIAWCLINTAGESIGIWHSRCSGCIVREIVKLTANRRRASTTNTFAGCSSSDCGGISSTEARATGIAIGQILHRRDIVINRSFLAIA